MQFNEIVFSGLTKESYLSIREIIRTELEDPKKCNYELTAWHKIYNALRGKKNCHEITKDHQDSYYHQICLCRAWKKLQESMEKTEVQEESNVGCTSGL